jgi:hypothetical protein
VEHEDRRLSTAELAALLEGQQRAREIITRAAVPAPPALRARIEAMRRPAHSRRGLLAGGVAVAALAAIAALLLIVLPGGSGLGPSVAQAVELAKRPATNPAPAARPGSPALLDAELEGLAFPEWGAEFGWQASGTRIDELDGRRARTVFYDKDGKRIAYTIVTGGSLARPAGEPVTVNGTSLSDVPVAAGGAVAWERRGHTCVLSGAEVPVEKLRELAAWRGGGAVES